MAKPAGAALREMIDTAAVGSIAALRGSPASRALQPKRHGGLALRADEFVAAVCELAAIDGSLGWVAAVVNAAAHEVDVRSPNAADDVWNADPHAVIATSGDTDGGSVRDGRLTGRWDAVVGAEFADWLLLSAHDGAACRVLVPRSTARIHPTDSPHGLQAAGICDVTVTEAAVDKGRIFASRRDDVAVVAGAGMAAAVVGTADGVWRQHVDQLRARLATSHGGQQVTDEVSAQLARAESDVDAARLQVATALERPDDIAAAARSFRQAVERARDAADRILSSGRHALDASNPVSRLWRDVHAGCRLADRLLDG
jgi:3-hydroxy-9,10-secoandrosta-1,3,5(10)-triene-9,17-dione monooxygenase